MVLLNRQVLLEDITNNSYIYTLTRKFFKAVEWP